MKNKITSIHYYSDSWAVSIRRQSNVNNQYSMTQTSANRLARYLESRYAPYYLYFGNGHCSIHWYIED